MLVNWIGIILCVLLVVSCSTWVNAGHEKTLRQLLNEEKAEEQAKERAVYEAESKVILEEFSKLKGEPLTSGYNILDPTSRCRQSKFGTKRDEISGIRPYYQHCDECCDHQGNGAWQEDSEQTSVGNCICKPRTYVNLCKYKVDKDSCKACCVAYSYIELVFIYDEEISFKESNGCKCKVKFLAPPTLY